MKKSQGELILAHLKAGKTISAKVAAQQYGCYRLGARIHELREAKYIIDGYWLAQKNRHAVFTYKLLYRPEFA
jgi:hypothetical protein